MKNEIQIEKNNESKVEKISKAYFLLFMEKAKNVVEQKRTFKKGIYKKKIKVMVGRIHGRDKTTAGN